MIKLFARPRVCDKAFRKLLFREGGSLLNTASDLSALAPYWSLVVIPAFFLQIKLGWGGVQGHTGHVIENIYSNFTIMPKFNWILFALDLFVR